MKNHINLIHNIWLKEVSRMKKPLKLIIIGEAPLSVKNYFYLNNGNYLIDLKEIYSKKCGEICSNLNENLAADGIILVELYKYLIDSNLYDNDNKFEYWDSYYFEDQIRILSEKKLIDKNTKIIFRYKKLCENFRGKNVEKHLICEVLPILGKYGFTLSNFFIKDGKFAPLTTRANGRLITNPEIEKFLDEIIGNNCKGENQNCNEFIKSTEIQKSIFNIILGLLKIKKEMLNIPNLALDSKNESKIISVIIENFTKNLVHYNHENIELWKWPEKGLLDFDQDLMIFKHDKLIDLLGCFKVNKPNSVYLYPCVINRVANQNNWRCDLLTELVYVHECAHYIHYYYNPQNFKDSPFVDKDNGGFYIESFAQLVTEKYCLKYKKKKPELLKIFNELCQFQSKEYTMHRDEIPSFGYYDFDFARSTYLETISKLNYSISTHFSKKLNEKLNENSSEDFSTEAIIKLAIDIEPAGSSNSETINIMLKELFNNYFFKV